MFPRKLKLSVSQQCGHRFRVLLPFPLTKEEHWQLGADGKADLIRKVIKKNKRDNLQEEICLELPKALMSNIKY